MTQILTYAKSTIVPFLSIVELPGFPTRSFSGVRTSKDNICKQLLLFLFCIQVYFEENMIYFDFIRCETYHSFLDNGSISFCYAQFFFLLSRHTNDVLFSISFFLMLYFNVVVQPKFLFSGSSGRYFNLYKSKKGTNHERQSIKG